MVNNDKTTTISYRTIDFNSSRKIPKVDESVTILNDVLGSDATYNASVDKFNNTAPYEIYEKAANDNKESPISDISTLYSDELQNVRLTYISSAYTKLVDEILNKYNNIYCGFATISKAGRGSKIAVSNNRISKNIPGIRAEGNDLSALELFVVIRGFPVRMKRFNITNISAIFTYPEYLLSSEEASSSFDYIYVSGYSSNIHLYNGASDSLNTNGRTKYSNSLANLNIIN